MSKQLKKLEIAYVMLDCLKPFAGNPRKIDPDEMKKLRRSLREFGFGDPVIARRRDGMVIGGHQRLEAARLEGWEKPVPVIYLSGLTDERAALLNVALNKISGEWDRSKLGDLFGELDTGDIDLELSGFDLSEIEGLMSGLDETIKEKEYDENLETENKCPQCGYEW